MSLSGCRQLKALIVCCKRNNWQHFKRKETFYKWKQREWKPSLCDGVHCLKSISHRLTEYLPIWYFMLGINLKAMFLLFLHTGKKSKEIKTEEKKKTLVKKIADMTEQHLHKKSSNQRNETWSKKNPNVTTPTRIFHTNNKERKNETKWIESTIFSTSFAVCLLFKDAIIVNEKFSTIYLLPVWVRETKV